MSCPAETKYRVSCDSRNPFVRNPFLTVNNTHFTTTFKFETIPGHAAVSSNKSLMLIDGKLGVECAHETLRMSSIGSPSNTDPR
jgi:hypothetical protein